MRECPLLDQIVKSHQEAQKVLQEAPCGYLLTNPKGNIVFVNDTLLNWLDFEREELVNVKRFQDLISAGERIFYESRHTTLLNLQKQVNEINYNLKSSNGRKLPMLVNSTCYRDDHDKTIAIQFVVFPFSDRKKYEQELLIAMKRSEEAAAAKTNFLSVISHEIRTPIHAILNASEILIKDTLEKEQSELVEVIHYASNNLLDTLNSVLNISKMEVGKLSPASKPFKLKAFLNELYKIYNPLAKKKNISFIINTPDHLPEMVVGDQSILRLVLMNLIGNAIKFTQVGSIRLKVTFTHIDGNVFRFMFSIADSGIGIRKNDLKKVFDPFTQANENIHQEYGGTGLGLSISKRILQILDSEIKVESKLGVGSKFEFELDMPISEESLEQNLQFNLSQHSTNLAKSNVLLVDDTYSNGLVTKRLLEKWKTNCVFVSSGKDVLKELELQNFDIILLDINMPIMDGYETAKMIRSLSENKNANIPIIALSAFDKNQIRNKVEAAGMNGVLQKPFKEFQLYNIIQKWIDKSASKQSVNLVETKDSDTQNQYAEFLAVKLFDLFDNDLKAIADYLEYAEKEVSEAIDEFKLSLNTYNLSIYKSAVHKNASKIWIFALDKLKEDMVVGENYLIDGKEELFIGKCKEIIKFLEYFNHWLTLQQEEVNNQLMEA